MSRRSFAQQVQQHIDKANRRLTAIMRESVQRLVHEANKPVAQGGKMPVATGYLRGSIGASESGLPTSESEPPELALLKFNLGDTLWVGWHAKYAPIMEAKYGFMRTGAQNWNHIVDQVTGEVMRRIK